MRNIEKINEEKMHKEKSLHDTPMPIEVGPVLPCFGLRSDELPEINDWKIGKEYILKIKVRMTEYTARKEKTLEKDEEVERGQFEIIGVETEEKK